jgi:plastocyanin
MPHVNSAQRGPIAAGRRSGIQFASGARRIATCVTFAALAASAWCGAAELTVTVVDRAGHGVGNVVVTAAGGMGGSASPGVPKTAVMDQRNLAFQPPVLVVAVGTRVDFPNSDSVSHQVYSFSPAKRFQLPLYKGEFHPPVTFGDPGLVVLGCNIHDSMVGYIVVTPAPYFGVTTAEGSLTLRDLPKGDYQLSIWSPYIVDAPAALSRSVHVEGGESASFALVSPLRALPEPRPRRRDWEY